MTSAISNIEAPCAHVELRPIFDFGDHCVVSSFYDAEYFGAYAAPIGEPACRDEVFDEASETLDYIFSHPKFGNVRRWYNGNEICIEITCKEDVFYHLADIYCVDAEDYEELGDRLGFEATEIAALTAVARAKQQSGT